MECLNQYLLTKPFAVLLASTAIALVVVLGAVAKPASAAEGDHMFCEAGDRKEKVTYFSAIFVGDYSYGSTRATLDFHSYLEDAGKDPDFSSTFCWPGSLYGEDTYEKAKRKLENRVREKQWYPYTDWAIVHTNWKPGYSAPQPPSESDDLPGRDGSDGCYFGECPDGTNPAQQFRQRGLICRTSEGWCEMSTALPIGSPCGCQTWSGRRIDGTTAHSKP